MEEKLKKYPKTEKFQIIDTIGVPHLYCITPGHLNFGRGILDKASIEEAEKNGVYCGICKGELSYAEHETALLVEVDAEGKELNDVPGLKEYLLKCKKLCEADRYAGFAFVKKRE